MNTDVVSNKNIILNNIYFILYIDGEDLTNLHIVSQSKEIQEKYESNDILSQEKKLELVDEALQYFYNFWKLIETNNNTKQYTMYFDINLLMIYMPISYYMKIKNVFKSLKPILQSNLKESFFKVDNKMAQYVFDFILTFYKPIKPLHLVKN